MSSERDLLQVRLVQLLRLSEVTEGDVIMEFSVRQQIERLREQIAEFVCDDGESHNK